MAAFRVINPSNESVVTQAMDRYIAAETTAEDAQKRLRDFRKGCDVRMCELMDAATEVDHLCQELERQRMHVDACLAWCEGEERTALVRLKSMCKHLIADDELAARLAQPTRTGIMHIYREIHKAEGNERGTQDAGQGVGGSAPRSPGEGSGTGPPGI